MIKSAIRSSIASNEKYRNASAGNIASTEYLIQTVEIGSTPVSSITFDVSAFTSVYKHLKLVAISRNNSTGTTVTGMRCRFNGDSSITTYRDHILYASGSTLSALYQGNPPGMLIGLTVGNNTTANYFCAAECDFIDAFSSTKYKTTKAITGIAGSDNRIDLHSSLWMSTSPITSMEIFSDAGQFQQYSRLSLYGVTA